MQAVVVVMIEPAGKSSFEVLAGFIGAESIEFLFIGLMAAFHFAVEARGARGDKAVLGLEALAQGGKGVDFDRAV